MSATRHEQTEIIRAGLKKRYARERRFRVYGIVAILISFAFLATLLLDIVSAGLPAFQQTWIRLDVTIDPAVMGVDKGADRDALFRASYQPLINKALRKLFPDVKGRKKKRALKHLASPGAGYQLRDQVVAHPEWIGATRSLWFVAKDDVDQVMKGQIDRSLPESERRVKDYQLEWIDWLKAHGRLEKRFNALFFTAGDSREPEQAGIRGALMGSFWTMLVTLGLSFPIGVLAALYLEQFAPQNNRWVDLVEININNLAAVPSIVFGLLGLAVFIGFFGMPRSAPLVGGMVLTLMTLPTIIIASRAAIKSVPPSIQEAALGLGASRLQTTFGHVLPLAMPGILTGTIIGMAQALGETAPLLLIGMVAFITEIPQGVMDSATVMPVQIYLWSDSPERAFTERVSAAIMVLLAFLALMNLIAVALRKRFEKKW